MEERGAEEAALAGHAARDTRPYHTLHHRRHTQVWELGSNQKQGLLLCFLLENLSKSDDFAIFNVFFQNVEMIYNLLHFLNFFSQTGTQSTPLRRLLPQWSMTNPTSKSNSKIISVTLDFPHTFMFLLSAFGPAASVTPSASSPSARRRESSTCCPQRRSRVRETRFPTHKKVLLKTSFLFPPQDFVARLADRFNRMMENVCGGGLGRTRWMREIVFFTYEYF